MMNGDDWKNVDKPNSNVDCLKKFLKNGRSSSFMLLVDIIDDPVDICTKLYYNTFEDLTSK